MKINDFTQQNLFNTYGFISAYVYNNDYHIYFVSYIDQWNKKC